MGKEKGWGIEEREVPVRQGKIWNRDGEVEGDGEAVPLKKALW